MIKRFSSKVRRFWASVALFSAEMTMILGLFLLAFTIFVYLIRRVFILNRTELDNNIFQFLAAHVSARNNEVMKAFTFLGTHAFLIPANLCLIAYFLFIKKHKWYSIKIPAIALSSLGLMFGLKHLFGRSRPEIPLLEEAKGLSVPSGHALFSVTFYGLLIYIIFKSTLKKEIKWSLISLLLMLIFVIGFTRIYLRVHYATDVIAGFCVGFIWLVFAVWMLNNLEKYSRRKLNPVVEQQAPATA
jgi:membrane-associated phospholipid phosphatase